MGASAGSQIKHSSAIPSDCGEHVSLGKLKKSLPDVKKKNYTVLDDGINMEGESEIPVEYRKHIFWQTSINGQRSN